jgi:hypothetical protein
MGVYTENIFKLSIKELLKNLKDIEGAIKQTKARIERTEYKIERNLINARKGNYRLESLNESLAIWEGKHDVNNRAFNAICDEVAEEIEQMKRDGRWDSDEGWFTTSELIRNSSEA